MGLKTEWVRYGSHSGFFAVPERAATPLPAVLVIQEIWGVEQHIEDVTRRIASAGYAALAADIYSVNGQRPAHLTRERVTELLSFLDKLPPAAWADPGARQAALQKLPELERGRVGETYTGLFGQGQEWREAFVPALRDAVRYLRHERPETKEQKVACVGFCMGGGLSALLACEEPELSGTAVYYGTTPPPEKLKNIRCPVTAFYAGNDQRVNAGIPAFEKGMKEIGRSYEHTVYQGVNHSFFNDTRTAYDVRAARDSFARLLTFFSRILT